MGRREFLPNRNAVRAIFIGVLAMLLVVPDLYAPAANANSTARTLRFYNIHTKEYVTVTYKVNDRFVPAAMDKLNRFMGDWRAKDHTKMDPELIDLIWRIYTQLGATEPIHLISGYRSQKTNNKLRASGGGQAKYSQHILGKAADIHIPGVPVKKLRNLALIQEFGGVGYYPNSGVPFVHVDTGRVRMWPRIPHMELAALFPDGKTDYIPSDGRRITQADYRRAASSGKYQTAADILRGRPSAPAPTAVASAEPPPLPTPSPFRQLSAKLASAGDTQPNNPLLAATNVNYRPMSLGKADETPDAPAASSAMASAPMPNRKPASPFAMASLGGAPSFSSNLAPAPAPKPTPAPQPVASADTASDASSAYRKTDVMSLPAQDEEHPEEALTFAHYNVAVLMSDRLVGYDTEIAPMIHPRQDDIAFVFEEMSIPHALELRDTSRVMSLAMTDRFEGTAVRSLYAALPGRTETQLASR
ncbi:DUF882 domain-containing protein [Methyloligella solikamskensis]|uniref:Murein endopeptidase K n=1 Tax=Methyloligella solikamskensis TaxID=1177756 RepID=A0ABW3J8J9_9HYPH